MSGTYPGSTTYPGATTYPGGAPPSGSATLTLTVAPVLSLQPIQRGSATVTLVADPVLRFGSPTHGFASLTLVASPVLGFSQFGSISTDPSISGVPEPGNFPPRVLLQAANITGPTAQVLRYGPDGHPVPVRSGDPAPLNSGAWIGYDYEAPYNQPVYYEIRPTDGSPSQFSTPVTLPVTRPWMVHPGVPDLSQPVTVRLLDDETMASSGGLHAVLGRSTSIPVTDGRRKAPSFAVQIKTTTADQRAALDQLFYDTAPLLLQVVYPFTDESDYRWIYVDTIVRGRRPSSAVYADPTRVWTLQCAEVDRPDGGLQTQRTWNDVMAECPTWRDVMAKYKTWRGVLTGIAGT